MAEQRIINTPTAEDYTNDSYVLIDGQTNGTRKILISNILKPSEPDYIYKWDFTQSLIDEIDGKTATLGKNAVRTNQGVSFTGKGDRVVISGLSKNFLINKTIEIDVVKFDFKGDTNYDMNFLVTPITGYTSIGMLEYVVSYGWLVYGMTANAQGILQSSPFSNDLNRNAFDGKTVKLKMSRPTSGYDYFELYLDDILVGTVNDTYMASGNDYKGIISIGSRDSNSQTNGDQCYDCIISGLRIYANEGV